MMNIEETFKYHAPTGVQTRQYEMIREEAKRLANLIDSFCPESREKAIALTNLQTSVMFANASIAIYNKVVANEK